MIDIAVRQSWNSKLSEATSGYKPGTTNEVYESGEALVREVEQNGVSFSNTDVLDVGCGNGRWAAVLHDRGVRRYVGLDIIPNSVEFCRELFREDPNFTFDLLPVRSRRYYSVPGQVEPHIMQLPDYGLFDIVVASSLFTHMETGEAAKRYLSEAMRMIRPGGVLYCTWFTSPPNIITGTEDRGFRTVYRKKDVESWLLTAGSITHSWDGSTDSHNDQIKYLVRKHL